MAALADMAAAIRLAALDVDGVLTDGKVTYDSEGRETKSFDIKDGLGIKLLQRVGIEVAIITGRQSTMVERRAAELGITIIVQGREDKLAAVNELAGQLQVSLDEVAYMGDDLPDLAAIQACGHGACPADAASPVLAAADWVASCAGGTGAVREWAEAILEARGDWPDLLGSFQL
jgi:3-deoxy-D-manno-octulosonate 8-phosphate phosphatase (KDO 8-P phosphatase)